MTGLSPFMAKCGEHSVLVDSALAFQTQIHIVKPSSEMKLVFSAAHEAANLYATPSLRNSSATQDWSHEVLSTPARSPEPLLSSHAEQAASPYISSVSASEPGTCVVSSPPLIALIDDDVGLATAVVAAFVDVVLDDAALSPDDVVASLLLPDDAAVLGSVDCVRVALDDAEAEAFVLAVTVDEGADDACPPATSVEVECVIVPACVLVDCVCVMPK